MNRVTFVSLIAVATIGLAASSADARSLVKGPMIHVKIPHGPTQINPPGFKPNPNINFGSWLRQQYQHSPNSFIAPCRRCG